MELVEGPTLAERITRRTRSRSTRRCRSRMQIADALEAAHEQRHHPSRSEARQHQGPARRHGEGAGLRTGEARRHRCERHRTLRSIAVADDDRRHRDDRPGRDPRHRGVHVAGAGAGPRRRQADRRLGVRCCALRDAHRQARVRRRRHRRDDRVGAEIDAGLVGAPSRRAAERRHADSAMPRQGSEPRASATPGGRAIPARRAIVQPRQE